MTVEEEDMVKKFTITALALVILSRETADLYLKTLSPEERGQMDRDMLAENIQEKALDDATNTVVAWEQKTNE